MLRPMPRHNLHLPPPGGMCMNIGQFRYDVAAHQENGDSCNALLLAATTANGRDVPLIPFAIDFARRGIAFRKCPVCFRFFSQNRYFFLLFFIGQLSSQCRKRACIVSPERRQPRRGYGCDDAQFARHFGDLQLIGAAPARSITAGVLARQRCTSHVASVFDEKVRKLLLRGESCGSVR